MKTGINPALKYIVITSNLYHNLRFHIFLCVNMNPRKDDERTVSSVPSNVLKTETSAAWDKPLSFITSI